MMQKMENILQFRLCIEAFQNGILLTMYPIQLCFYIIRYFREND